jgi:hypothetical protein
LLKSNGVPELKASMEEVVQYLEVGTWSYSLLIVGIFLH